MPFEMSSDQHNVILSAPNIDNCPAGCITLYRALKFLEENGAVRAKVAVHKVDRQQSDAGDTPEAYTVKTTGTCCYKMIVKADSAATHVNCFNILSLHMPALKASDVLRIVVKLVCPLVPTMPAPSLSFSALSSRVMSCPSFMRIVTQCV